LLGKLVQKEIENLTEYKNATSSEKQQIKAKYTNDKDFIDRVKNLASTIQIGIVVIDQTTGAVLGLVGASPKSMAENPDAKYSLNHAVQIRRQPGSSFKPFVYAAALITGNTPDTQIETGPYNYLLPTGET